MRYAQEYGGQKLHLVAETDRHLTGKEVEDVALCGRTNRKRGGWRMTCNLPLAHACRNCTRVYSRRVGR